MRLRPNLKGAELKRTKAVLDLPPKCKDLKLLVTEENLKRVGIFSEKVGTLLPFYRFHYSAPLNVHSYSRDALIIDSDEEVKLNNTDHEGRVRL